MRDLFRRALLESTAVPPERTGPGTLDVEKIAREHFSSKEEAEKQAPRIRSCELFGQILMDIAIHKYDVPGQSFFSGYSAYPDGSYSITLSLNEEKLDPREIIRHNAALSMMMRDLAVEDFEQKAFFDNYGYVIYFHDKADLHAILENFFKMHEKVLRTPESVAYEYKAYRGYDRNQIVGEVLAHNAIKAREGFEKEPDMYNPLFFSLVASPLTSTSHYLANMATAALSTISVSMDHLRKVIQQEDRKYPVNDSKDSYVPGGFH